MARPYRTRAVAPDPSRRKIGLGHSTDFEPDLSGVRTHDGGDHADRRLPVVLRLPALRRGPQAQARRLLRLLLIWRREMPADPGRVWLLRLGAATRPSGSRPWSAPAGSPHGRAWPKGPRRPAA
jgi:hypothetical protein